MYMVRVEQRSQRERRGEARYPIHEFSVLRSPGEIAAVRVLDISAMGLRVTSLGPMPIGTEVEVQFGGAKVSGLVSNCRCIRAAEFQLGIFATSLCVPYNIVPERQDHLSIRRRAQQPKG